MSDRFLHDMQESPNPQFLQSLYQRINTPIKQESIRVRRFAFGTMVCLLLLSLTLALWPTSRVYARQMIQKIGHWIFPDSPTYAEQYEAAHSSPTVDEIQPSGAPVEWQAPPLLSLDEAAAQAGFTVIELQSIPSGLSLISRSVSHPDDLNPFIAVVTVYSDGISNLSFSQMQFTDSSPTVDLPVGDAIVEDVQMGDIKALWIEHMRLSTTVDENQHVVEAYANVLIWETDQMEFYLQSTPGLPQSKMVEIAESAIAQ